jgi:hypothetical protein
VDPAEATLAHYITANGQLRANLLATLARMWAALTSWRDADAAAFAAQAVPAVAGAQQATATLTAAYLARIVAQMSGSPLTPPRLNPRGLVGEAVRKAPPAEVYRRPFVQVYTELGKGTSLDAAVAAGGRRLQSIAATDLQLAKTHTAQRVLRNEHRVVGYRRVLTGDHSCGLCLVASTQRYHKSDLLPIHPECDCSVAPLLGDEDPGQVIDEGRLAGTHAAVADRFGSSAADARRIDYRKVLITHQHGEIGPVLAVKGQHFDRGPNRR